ncbi:hypothetical protein A2U01_0006327, partial [Trifolium medium]|nr:hypothetical protein [Trifolium medium]
MWLVGDSWINQMVGILMTAVTAALPAVSDSRKKECKKGFSKRNAKRLGNSVQMVLFDVK